MATAIVDSRALVGVHAPCVTVEVHVAGGLPGIHVVGLPGTEVCETRDRVRIASQNAPVRSAGAQGGRQPRAADLPKESGRYDLPIALGFLAATGRFSPGCAHDRRKLIDRDRARLSKASDEAHRMDGNDEEREIGERKHLFALGKPGLVKSARLWIRG